MVARIGSTHRSEAHPLVRFRSGAAGRRRPYLAGTRLYIHQVIDTLHDSDGDIAATAEYFGIQVPEVRAALAYYADFEDEVEQDAVVAKEIEAASGPWTVS
jgi:uncharacterized protein (DUF433 family)